MLLYYRGRDPHGSIDYGSIVATDRRAALRLLQARGLLVTSIDVAASPRGVANRLARALQWDSAQRLAAFRSLAALVQAGLPLRRAIETLLERRSRNAFDALLRDVAAQIDGGSSLSDAMRGHPHAFSSVAIAIVTAGEAGGSLDSALETIAQWEERDRALRRRILAALTYPAVVSLAAAGLLTFLVGQTIPSFAVSFAQMHVQLPLITRLLLRMGAVVDTPQFWLAMVLGAAALSALGFAVRSDYKVGLAVDRIRLRIPTIGAIFAKATAARLARTLGSLLRSGVHIVAAIDICGAVVGPAYRVCLTGVAASLRRGDGLAQPFAESELFEPEFAQLVRSGEESGTVDEMLLRLARFYENDVETSLAALSSILEPFLICTLGLAVGTIVASIIIPLYTMIGNIQ